MLKETLPEGEITHIIASHSHADHIGGIKFWKEPDTEVIAHVEFAEVQRKGFDAARHELLVQELIAAVVAVLDFREVSVSE